MNKLIKEIEALADWNKQTDIDIGGDYGYDGERNGNAGDKIESLQNQLDLLLTVVKQLICRTQDCVMPDKI